MNVAALTLPFSFEQPQWLWLCLLIPALVALSLRSLAGLEPVRRVLALVVRSLVIVTIAISLARVLHVRENENLTVLFLMDRSDSVPEDIQASQESFIAAACEDPPPHDRVGVIDFARHAYVQQPPYEGGYYLEPGRLPRMPNPDRTDIASAIRMAMAIFPHDTAKRIVLLTDGNDNMGDVLQEAATARADGAVIDVVPLWYQHRNEIYFDRMVAPTNAEEGEQVPIRLVVHSRRRAVGAIDLYHNDRKVHLPPEFARVELAPGDNVFLVKLPIRTGGPQRFEARFVAEGGSGVDAISENNTATTFTFVAGKRKALVLSKEPTFDEGFVDALRSEKVDVDLRDVSGDDIVIDLLEMLNYSTIILSNVPAYNFTDEQLEMLSSYVKDLGGGLIMIGGDESFGAGGWMGTPVEEVMPVSFEIKHKKVIPRGALVLIMHSCEIPRGNFWGKEAAKKSVDTISSRDYIGVLAYTWSPGGVNWEVPLGLVRNKAAVKNRIDKMQIGDMPDFATTMDMALEALVKTDASQKHIIIISDGDPSAPSRRTLDAMVQAKITCSTIGIGYGSHVVERTLRDIATKTKGQFHPCRSPRRVPKLFMKESKVVRRSLIDEKPFRPKLEYAFSEVLTGIDADEVIPPLQGMVLTSPKPMALVPLVRPTKEGPDPVLAHWQYELGKTVAFTSGYWPRWGYQWTQWPSFAKLWAQVVRWTMRQEAPANFEVYTRIEGTRGRVVVEALDKDASYLNFLNLPGAMIKPDQTVAPLLFTQSGPGHYEATFDVDQTGQYIANVNVLDGADDLGAIYTGVSIPFSPEFRELSTNETILQQVREVTGGRWLGGIDEPGEVDVFSHDLPPTIAKQPVWDWIIAWLLLPLFLLDVALRRLASWLAFSIAVETVVLVFLLVGVGTAYSGLWGVLGTILLAELIGWSIRFRSIGPMLASITHTVTVLGRAGERSTAALGQLKSTRDRVREERTSAGETPDRAAPPIPDRSARFDAGEVKGAAVGDLHESLGGAKAQPEFKEKRRKPAGLGTEEAGQEDEDTTSRLLRAKRRARRGMEDEKKDKGD
ncbi:MAG: VWA domain-containing protein [Phycisphaerales bacterium]|nr:MAG: VWA domain-containing protein [Phycisphaerales bacterium]